MVSLYERKCYPIKTFMNIMILPKLAVRMPAISIEMTVPREVPAYVSADMKLLSAGGAHLDNSVCIAGNVTPWRQGLD